MRNVSTSMNAEMNVTPFLDVLLVLLILFMYLCLNQQKVIAAQLPDRTPDAVTESTQIVLEVRTSATYAINTQVVPPGQLGSQLRGIYAGRPDKTIIVRAAPGVRYQEVVTAIDIAKGAGVVAVGLDGGTKTRR